MRITGVRACVVKGNFPWVFVKVLTDKGIFGIGEAYWGIGVRETIIQMESLLRGKDPLQIDALIYEIRKGLSGTGSQAGTVVMALSGIEIALWDIAGKALGIPVWRLLGGKFRERVRIYCDCHAGRTEGVQWDYTPKGYAERAKAVTAKGFNALKFDIDIPTPYNSDRGRGASGMRSLSEREIRFIVDLIKAVRDAVGDAVDIALDCHWQFNTKDALRLAEALAPLKPWWLEDPIPSENIDAFAEVKRKSPLPICTGENLYTAHQFRELIVKQACDIIAPDIPKMGGLREAQKVAILADLYYLPLAPHNISSPVGTIAACHLCATFPNFLALEFHAVDLPWWEEVVFREEGVIHGGFIEVSDRPGLGVELNEEVLRRHLVAGEEFFS